MKWLLIAAAICASGCTTIQSRSAQTGTVGWAYSAPIRHLTITATRTQAYDAGTTLRLERARTALSDATTAATAAQRALESAIIQARAARDAVAAASDAQRADAERNAQRKELDVVHAREDLARAREAETQREGAYTRLLASASADATQWAERIQIAPGAAEADPDARFSADLHASAFRSDNGIVRIGANSLLQSSNITSEGQLDEAIVAIAEGLVTLAVDVPRESLGEEETPSRAPDCDAQGHLSGPLTGATPRSESLQYSINPVNVDEIDAVNVALCRLNFSYRIDAPDLVRAGASAAAQRAPCPTRRAADGTQVYLCNGLVYRQNEPFRMNIRRIELDAEDRDRREIGALTEQAVFRIPNAAPLNVISYGSALFVTRRTDVTFSDGSLAEVNYTHPSEVATAAGVPLRVLQAGARTVGEVVRLRVNIDDALHPAEKQTPAPPGQ